MNIKLEPHPAREVLLIFLVCIIVYLANGTTINPGDTVPNTLLAFNLFENHTLNLDIFRKSHFCVPDCPYFFAEGNYGHLSYTYPIGPALITLPLYVFFYGYLKLIHHYALVPLDITSVSFEVYRFFFEKLAATITTASTVVIFYLSLRLKFNRTISLISTFIFAFATNTWMTSSQTLWQHSISNLALVIIVFCLLKANHTSEKQQRAWLVIAGIACGLLPGIRPTSTIYAIAAVVYSVFTYRSQSIFLLSGLLSALPSISWNLYYFGNMFSGGYSKMFPNSPYIFTFNNFISTSLGILVSPSRGLLIFSPILLYALPGTFQLFKLRFGKDEKLLGCMLMASIVLLTSYCFYSIWWAGHSYGPRFLTDILPIVCFVISYALATHKAKLLQTRTIFTIKFLVFVTLLIISIFTQVVGAFGANPGVNWDATPLDVDKTHNQKLWNLQDSQIERNFKSVFHKIIKPATENPAYVEGLSGSIKQVFNENNPVVVNSLISVAPSAEISIKANVENTGKSRWFGYESALEKGEVRIRGRFYDAHNTQLSETRLYVSGTPKLNESTHAIGTITFPKQPGMYKFLLDLVAEGIGEFPHVPGKSPYLLYINVGNQPLQHSEQSTSKIFSQEIKIVNNLSNLKLGTQTRIPVIIKNTSNFLWSSTEPNPTNFSYRWLDANTRGKPVVVPEGERTPLPYDLAVGESAAINAVIKTPSKPGKYSLVLTMVQESVAWFSDKQAQYPNIDVTITSDS